MTPQDCKYFNTCSAPICPLYSNPNPIWYPDEEICRAKAHHNNAIWVQSQKKITKKARRTDLYFSYNMLNKDVIIRAGIEGVDPDANNPDAEVKKWLRNHPERTQQQKQKAQQQAQQNFKKVANE